jgi:hypothetical protein
MREAHLSPLARGGRNFKVRRGIPGDGASRATTRITIRRPDDWHLHDGEMLKATLQRRSISAAPS